jgi:L-threonylcarbamoyladenylate synthase
LRKRDPKKPMIVLVGGMKHVTGNRAGFGIALSPAHRALLTRLWPNKISVVLPCQAKKFAYLHRGTKTIAFRMPKPKRLRDLLKKTGPLVAPSANWEGRPPATTIAQAKRYFGPVRSSPPSGSSGARLRAGATSNGIDFYVNAGVRNGKPSTLVALKNGKIIVLREGAVKISRVLK